MRDVLVAAHRRDARIAAAREEAAAILSAARERVDSLEFKSLHERHETLALELKRAYAEAAELQGELVERAGVRDEAAAILSAAHERVDSLEFKSLHERHETLALELKRAYAEAAELQAGLDTLLSRSKDLDPASLAGTRADDGRLERPALNPDRLYSARLIALPLMAAGQSREQIAAELERQLGPDAIDETLDHVLGRSSEL